MAYPGQVIRNPVNKELLVFVKTGRQTRGELFQSEAYYEPGGFQAEHQHPFQEERITIIHGSAHLALGGETRILRSGDTVIIPAGTPHHFVNGGEDELLVTTVLRPALHTDELWETVGRLSVEGKLGKNNLAGLLQLAVLQREFALEMGLSRSLLLKLLYPLAVRLGYRLRYHTHQEILWGT